MEPIKTSRPVWIEAGAFSNIQFIMVHPLDGHQFSFDVVNGKAETSDPYVLRCLLDHPKRNDPFPSGGFLLVGSDEELEKLYSEAVGEKGKEQNPLAAAQNRVKELEREVEEISTKLVGRRKK